MFFNIFCIFLNIFYLPQMLGADTCYMRKYFFVHPLPCSDLDYFQFLYLLICLLLKGNWALKLLGVSCRDLNIVFTFTPLPKLEFCLLLCNLCCVFSNLYLDTSNMGLNLQISSLFCCVWDCFLTMTNHILLIDLFVCGNL